MDISLDHVATAWAAVYANSPAIRTALGFAHVGGLVVAGGTALSADRAVLRAGRAGHVMRERQAGELTASHRWVLTAMTFVMASGVLLALADLDTYLDSKTFWLKMGAILLLTANGALMMTLGRRIERGHDGSWTALRATAMASVTLWLLTTLLGTALPNVS
jgi:hypothetical protein